VTVLNYISVIFLSTLQRAFSMPADT